MTVMVDVRSLAKRFGPMIAVDGLSFSVAQGEVMGFLGPNGSGKSTTMRMLTGFLLPSAGTAQICGIDVLEDPVAARRQLGYLPEGAPAYGDMTPQAYLRFVAAAHGLSGPVGREAVACAIDMTNLGAVAHQRIDTLSKGYKRRVGLAHALVHDPQVLILDEPTDGLDPNQKHEVRSLITEMAPDKAIIISTHILEEVHAVCTRALIIARGRQVMHGTPLELEAHSRYHNAVALTLPASDGESARAALMDIDGVAEVEQQALSNGRLKMTALAEPGQDILATVSPMVRASDLQVEQMAREAVHLDEVFRAMTSADPRPVSAPSARGDDIARTRRAGNIARDTWTVFQRELGGYFNTPLAYVFIIIFVAAVGALTFFAGNFFALGQATLEVFFQFHPWLYLFLIPAIAMRLWAEERKSGSIELLLTLPMGTTAAVLGKFLAAWTVAGVGLLLTTSFWITVNYLGSPDNGIIAASYAGSLLMAGAYLAIGVLASALTSSQVIAFIVAAAACFAFTAGGLRVVLELGHGWAPELLLSALATFSFLEHYQALTRGVLDLRDIVFFLSSIAFFLFATVVAVERNKGA